MTAPLEMIETLLQKLRTTPKPETALKPISTKSKHTADMVSQTPSHSERPRLACLWKARNTGTTALIGTAAVYISCRPFSQRSRLLVERRLPSLQTRKRGLNSKKAKNWATLCKRVKLACHNGLEESVSTALSLGETHFVSALKAAAVLHNSTPHRNIGVIKKVDTQLPDDKGTKIVR